MYSVLYVDDEPHLLEIGQMYLQKYWNITVTTATSAQEALDYLSTSTFDVIVSDYQMPEMDGISFLKFIRKEDFPEPFILFTGKGREEVVIEALNNGADYYLQKGGPPKAQFTELVNMIRRAVEKKQADIEINRANHLSNAIINHLPDPTFVVNADGIIISWNHAIEKTTGFFASDILGKNISEWSSKIFGSSHLSLVDLILNPAQQIPTKQYAIEYEGDTITAEIKSDAVSGKDRIFWIKASPLYDQDKQFIGAIETLRDITSIRKNERDLILKSQELRETGQQLQNIIDFIPDPTFAVDNYGKVIVWNRAIERMTGTDATAIIGEGDHAYSEQFYSERRPTLIDIALNNNHEIMHKYDFVKKEHHHFVGEAYCDKIYEGGGAFIWAVAAPLKDTQGNITGAIESIRDITSRKELELELQNKYEDLAISYEEIASQNEEIRASFEESAAQQHLLAKSERRFRSLIEHLPDGIIIHQEGEIQYSNPMACRILGYDGPYGLIGTPALDIVHPNCRENIYERVIRAAEIKQPFVEELFLKKDGTQIPVEVAGIRILKEDSVSVMTIFRDITHENERKSALRQAQKKLEVLASITRHDINNQLTIVMSILDVVSSGDIPDIEAKLIEKAFTPCNNILEQLKTTFEYQTIGVQDPGWFCLQKIVSQSAQVHQIAPSMYSYSGEDVEIYADPLITKVIENLMDNSIRHGRNLQKIVCQSTIVDDNLLFVYEDDGGGVADEDKGKIFAEGYGKHTGLGLFLIHEILAMTGISIRECGVYGKGVRFEMLIPHGMWRVTPTG